MAEATEGVALSVGDGLKVSVAVSDSAGVGTLGLGVALGSSIADWVAEGLAVGTSVADAVVDTVGLEEGE